MKKSISAIMAIKRKETILTTAIEILYEMGIQGLTTKEIARREGITEPAIYRQYSGKKEIILAIIEQFGQYDESIRSTIREQSMDIIEAIEFFMGSYAAYYENCPQLLSLMFSYDVYRYEAEAAERMGSIMEQRYGFLTSLVEEGQREKRIDCNIDAGALSRGIMGVLFAAAYTLPINKSLGSLKEEVMTMVRWMLRHSHNETGNNIPEACRNNN